MTLFVSHCRSNPEMCAQLGYCHRAVTHRQPDCKTLDEFERARNKQDALAFQRDMDARAAKRHRELARVAPVLLPNGLVDARPKRLREAK